MSVAPFLGFPALEHEHVYVWRSWYLFPPPHPSFKLSGTTSDRLPCNLASGTPKFQCSRSRAWEPGNEARNFPLVCACDHLLPKLSSLEQNASWSLLIPWYLFPPTPPSNCLGLPVIDCRVTWRAALQKHSGRCSIGLK